MKCTLQKFVWIPSIARYIEETGFANRYEMHRLLLGAFPAHTSAQVGLLYRLETVDANEPLPIVLLVQTQLSPGFERLYQDGLLLQPVDVKPFETDLPLGSRFIFRLLANPTQRRQQGDYAGKRVELNTLEEHEQWLARKAQLGGFSLEGLNTTQLGKVISSKMLAGKKQVLTHQAVRYEGLLRVEDSVLFKRHFERGIGSAKAFGFGLLSHCQDLNY